VEVFGIHFLVPGRESLCHLEMHKVPPEFSRGPFLNSLSFAFSGVTVWFDIFLPFLSIRPDYRRRPFLFLFLSFPWFELPIFPPTVSRLIALFSRLFEIVKPLLPPHYVSSATFSTVGSISLSFHRLSRDLSFFPGPCSRDSRLRGLMLGGPPPPPGAPYRPPHIQC